MSGDPDLADRGAQIIFECIARMAELQRCSLAFASATICWLLAKQLKRVDALAARDVFRALSYECSNGDNGGFQSFKSARAALVEKERP